MSRVIQAVDSIHQVGIYCLALVDANHLPKTPLGGIHVADTRARFIDGSLHATNLLMCPHSCVTNLPKPREAPAGKRSNTNEIKVFRSDVGPAAMFVGNIVQGIRIANASGRAMSAAGIDEPMGAASMIEQLAAKAHGNPDHTLYTFIGAKAAEVRLSVGLLSPILLVAATSSDMCGIVQTRRKDWSVTIRERSFECRRSRGANLSTRSRSHRCLLWLPFRW